MPWMVYDYPEPKYRYVPEFRCPVCGGVCDTVYRDRDWQIVGCTGCMTEEEAEEVCYE